MTHEKSALLWGVTATIIAVLGGLFAGHYIFFTNINKLYGWPIIALSLICVLLIWTVGVREILSYLISLAIDRFRPIIDSETPTPEGKRVVLLYCTSDDFDPRSLGKSMKQSYPGVTTVILDDSNTEESRKKIDAWAKKRDVTVHRREGREGFKAGNLNSYLLGRKDYDYFVILDADEVLSKNFIENALKYFAEDKSIGIVQGHHSAKRMSNEFTARFAPGLEPSLLATNRVKTYFGYAAMLGHGAMISRKCFESVGKIPEVVLEDLAFSLETSAAGWRIIYAPNVRADELFPISYHAFRKQHLKLAQGRVEFLQKYARLIWKAPLPWFAKLDLITTNLAVPIVTLAGFVFLLNNTIVMSLLDWDPGFPVWVGIVLFACSIAALLPDITNRLRIKQDPFWIAIYTVQAMALHSSVFMLVLRTTLLGMLGRKAKYPITPKVAEKVSRFEAIRIMFLDILIGALVMSACWIVTGNPVPALMLVLPPLMAVWYARMSNKAPKKDLEVNDYVDKLRAQGGVRPLR